MFTSALLQYQPPRFATHRHCSVWHRMHAAVAGFKSPERIQKIGFGIRVSPAFRTNSATAS